MTFPKFYVWKVESTPYQCFFHILYAAFLYDKMNYQRVSKVNQEFFLLYIKWDHMGHWRLLVTYPKVLYVCVY